MLFKRLKSKAKRLSSYAQHQWRDNVGQPHLVLEQLEQALQEQDTIVLQAFIANAIGGENPSLLRELLERISVEQIKKMQLQRSILRGFEEAKCGWAQEALLYYCQYIKDHGAYDLLGSSGHARGRALGALGSAEFWRHDAQWCYQRALIGLADLMVQVVLESNLHEGAATVKASCLSWLDVSYEDREVGQTLMQMSAQMLSPHPVWMYPIERPCALEILSKKGFKKCAPALLLALGEERFKALRFLYGNESLAHLAAKELDVNAWEYCLDHNIGFPGKPLQEQEECLNYQNISLSAQEIQSLEESQSTVSVVNTYLYALMESYTYVQSTGGAALNIAVNTDRKKRFNEDKALSGKWIDAFTKMALSEVEKINVKMHSERVLNALNESDIDVVHEEQNMKKKTVETPKESESLWGLSEYGYVHPVIVLAQRAHNLFEAGKWSEVQECVHKMLYGAVMKHKIPSTCAQYEQLMQLLPQSAKSALEAAYLERSLGPLVPNASDESVFHTAL